MCCRPTSSRQVPAVLPVPDARLANKFCINRRRFMRLVQFELSNGERRVGVVEDGLVREVQDAHTMRDLALAAIEAGTSLERQVQTLGLGISHNYAELLAKLRILPPLDHPDPALMLVSGTG